MAGIVSSLVHSENRECITVIWIDPRLDTRTRLVPSDENFRARFEFADSADVALQMLYTCKHTGTLPNVIFLAWIDGFPSARVLREIKQDSTLRTIPVVVFTPSHSDEHAVSSIYDLYASCVLEEPDSAEEMKHVMETVAYFWFKNAQLPSMRGYRNN